jgi:hypothetical protein
MSAARIAELNDKMRRTFNPCLGKVVMTRAVADCDPKRRERIFRGCRCSRISMRTMILITNMI